jgi:quinol monooxygenase YgiN
MIIVIGHVTAKPETHDEVLALSLEHVKRSRAEPGCIAHNVSLDGETENRFVFVEYWADMPALMTHFALDASRQFVRDLTKLVAEEPEMKIFQAEETSPSAR